MTVNQEVLLDTRHVQEQCGEHVWKCTHERDIDKTTHQQPQKGLALRFDATLGIKAHRWVTARTSTAHRCPQGKAVGGPQHDPQCDKRAPPKR